MSLEITTPNFEDLTKQEQADASSNGGGKEYANYIRISRNGESVYLESDAMEPEDARFTRDLEWIKDAIAYAYQCGVQDGKTGAL